MPTEVRERALEVETSGSAAHEQTIQRYRDYVTTSFVAAIEPVAVGRRRRARPSGMQDGTEYVDCFAGIAVVNAGHRHPKVIAAAKAQMDEVVHAATYIYHVPVVGRLGERLAEITPGRLQKTFFGNSGAEGIETAMRLAKAYTGKQRVHHPDPLLPRAHGRHPLHHRQQGAQDPRRPVPAGDRLRSGAVRLPQPVRHRRPGGGGRALRDDGRVGDRLPVERRRRRLHRRAGDGRGRHPRAAGSATSGGSRRSSTATASSSSPTRCNRASAAPASSSPSSTMASSRTSWSWPRASPTASPSSATIAPPEIADSLKPGEHLSTFGGNPVCCAAGLANIEVMQEERLPEESARKGEHVMARLREMAERHPLIGEVRGLGLMIGVELVKDRDDQGAGRQGSGRGPPPGAGGRRADRRRRAGRQRRPHPTAAGHRRRRARSRAGRRG